MGADYMQSTGGSYPFFAPEMCRAMRGAGYSGRAADMWAVGVSLFMWMYHKPPYESDSVVNLMEKIATEEVTYPEDGTHSRELKLLLMGLLERMPKVRFKVRDLRRDAWLTRSGKAPLPAGIAAPNAMAVAKADLANAVKRVALLQRAEGPSAAPAATASAGDAAEGEGGDEMEQQRAQVAREAAEEAAEEAAA